MCTFQVPGSLGMRLVLRLFVLQATESWTGTRVEDDPQKKKKKMLQHVIDNYN